MDVGKIGNIPRLMGASGRRDKRPVGQRKGPREGETVSISTEARKAEEGLAYVRMLREMPDLREEKVEEIRRKIASGGYPDSDVLEETTKKMLSG